MIPDTRRTQRRHRETLEALGKLAMVGKKHYWGHTSPSKCCLFLLVQDFATDSWVGMCGMLEVVIASMVQRTALELNIGHVMNHKVPL